MGDEHVVGRGDFFAVEQHLRDGVEPVGAQLHPVLAQKGGGHGERGAVFPVALLDPLEVELVGAVERVGDLVGGEQIGVHAAGHGGGEPFRGGGVAKTPGGEAEVEGEHGRGGEA